MKKFINEHPKLYWMIVGALAVIVFSIVTVVGCAKLERAEAAEEISNPCNLQIEASVAENISSVLPFEDYFSYAICVEDISVHFKRYYLFDILPTFDAAGGNLRASSDYSGKILILVVNTDNVISNAEYRTINNSSYQFETDYDKFIGSSFDIGVSGYVGNNFEFKTIVPPMTYSYLVNAPYAVIDDFVDYNEHLNTNFTKLENDEITVEFSLGGQPMNPEYGYLLDYTLYVWLPSKLYINNHYGDFSEQYFATQCGKNKDEFTADMKTWRYGVGTNSDSVLYKLPLKYEFYNNPETGEAGEYRIQLDYKDIIDYLETAYGDGENDFSFEDYYDNENFTGYLWDFVLSHMVVSRMDALVYTQIDDVDTYYGRTTTFTFLRNGNFVYSEVNKDALNEDISSDISDGINNALQEGLIQSGDKVDELQQNINNVSGSLGSFDTEFEGVDLWNGIKGFGSGLVGLTGFLGNIATVLGSVFVFMPYDVRQLVGYFFMASLVVALWKLIKR